MAAELRAYNRTKITSNYSLTTTYNFDAINVQDIEGFTLQINWTDALNLEGTFSLEASIDNINFATIPASSQSVPSTILDGTHVYDMHSFHYPYVRLVWTRTAGSATIDIWYCNRGRAK